MSKAESTPVNPQITDFAAQDDPGLLSGDIAQPGSAEPGETSEESEDEEGV